jgi:hypothetical protein
VVSFQSLKGYLLRVKIAPRAPSSAGGRFSQLLDEKSSSPVMREGIAPESGAFGEQFAAGASM